MSLAAMEVQSSRHSRNGNLQRKCDKCRTNDDHKGTIVHRSAVNGTRSSAHLIALDEDHVNDQPQYEGAWSFRGSRFQHDFSGVTAHGGPTVANWVRSMNAPMHEQPSNWPLKGDGSNVIPVRPGPTSNSMHIDGTSTIASLNDLDEIYIDGNGDDKKVAPAPKVTPPNPSPPPPREAPSKQEASACPTDIKVAEVRSQSLDANLAESGVKTGLGGYAAMEVSGPGRKSWDGTAIHENLGRVKNTCEAPGACSNANGNSGASGSTFKVGDKANFLGRRALSAKKNTFYDQHAIAMKDSWLHKSRKPTCEIQCEQQYDCNGTRFGPAFLITYSFTRDTINSDQHSYYVTQIEIKKEVKK
jgi:hypothetical protein